MRNSESNWNCDERLKFIDIAKSIEGAIEQGCVLRCRRISEEPAEATPDCSNTEQETCDEKSAFRETSTRQSSDSSRCD
jgi:hypothetical protein